MNRSVELNLDGLVGPTHGYAGLAYGNLASVRNRQMHSNPRQAALEGLDKMKLLANLGIPQAVLPPHQRPYLPALRQLGFTGDDARVLENANRTDPALLAACCSASSMWAANTATISPSADTADHRVHITPANLVSQFHRALEAPMSGRILRAVFADEASFVHHPPLPGSTAFADEGAANQMRLCGEYAGRGVEVFVFGRSAFATGGVSPQRYPARQTREASAALARLHQLLETDTVLLQQNPTAIDVGAFHNDVVAVANLDRLLIHAAALLDQSSALTAMRHMFRRLTQRELRIIEVSENQVPLVDAVQSYLFNSQLVRLPDRGTCLIAPIECSHTPSVAAFLANLQSESGFIDSVHFVDVRQSMRNGGGPACLRLRVPLTNEELSRVHPGVILNESLHAHLRRWIERHYREQLLPSDLADPRLLNESQAALDELTRLLNLGSVYDFQRS